MTQPTTTTRGYCSRIHTPDGRTIETRAGDPMIAASLSNGVNRAATKIDELGIRNKQLRAQRDITQRKARHHEDALALGWAYYVATVRDQMRRLRRVKEKWFTGGLFVGIAIGAGIVDIAYRIIMMR